MKAKELHKRLTLNKTTIANLNIGEMKRVKGGRPIDSENTYCTYIYTVTNPSCCSLDSACESFPDICPTPDVTHTCF